MIPFLLSERSPVSPWWRLALGRFATPTSMFIVTLSALVTEP